MRFPYIYISPREFAQQAVDFDNERGVMYRRIEGEHALWAVRVPFLPAMISDDFTRMGQQRLPLIMRRQFRFINDLARAREHQATIELRFLATPNPVPGQPNLIDIVFLGKVFSVQPRGGQKLAERLWEKFVNNFPLEDPFNYPLEPISGPDEFLQYYAPLNFDELEAAQVLEIRKYEDMPISSPSPGGRVERIGDYIAHPFVPSFDFSAMGRFLTALAAHEGRCYVGVSLRPTRLYDQEIHNMSFAVGRFRHLACAETQAANEYVRARAQVGTYVYEHLLREREQLLQIRVHLVSEHGTPYGLAEALGSEMMGNADNQYPTRWVLAQPADEREFGLALNNLRYLEHDVWGYSETETPGMQPLQRLRYLATAQEAYGAFRLPIPPESGYMPGVLVKHEPFVAPADELELRRQARVEQRDGGNALDRDQAANKIDLGVVYHRGNPTAQHFQINVRDLTRHALIAGSTGSGKSTTIKHLLAQLWGRHQVPFLVLYPIDKPDYRELRGFQGLAQDLLVFTLGDESTAPFRFNPFEVTEGLLLKTHLSRLMRVFMAAFSLHDPLPMIYREALRRVYRDYGWNPTLDRGTPGRAYPLMSDFYRVIGEITNNLKYGREVQDNVRQASVIRIGDLLENAGHVVNVRQSMALQTILNKPTVMEIGRVGSAQDTALLMGFLLMRFAEEVERNPRPLDHPHITVVEEAHRLMAETAPGSGDTGDSRGAAGEDFSNILAEVRGHGEGIIIAEQIPTLLVKGAIGNTYLKVMHWLEDPPSFDLFSSVINLNVGQQEYARTLTPGFALVRSPYGKPVHINVPDVKTQVEFSQEGSRFISDRHIKAFMEGQRRRLNLEDVPVVEWEAGLAVTTLPPQAHATDVREISRRLLTAPMRSCAFCQPLLNLTLTSTDEQCPFRKEIRHFRVTSPQATQVQRTIAEAAAVGEQSARWETLRALGQALKLEPRGAFYCLLAHEADLYLDGQTVAKPTDSQTKKQYRRLLREFDDAY